MTDFEQCGDALTGAVCPANGEPRQIDGWITRMLYLCAGKTGGVV